MKVANSPLRRPSLRFVWQVIGVSLLVAVIAAIVAWPLRREANRTGTDAWVPFRALRAEEAALLFKHSFNGRPLLRILAVDQDHVDVATSRYVLPPNVTSEEAPDGLPSASWESFITVHRISRAEFEHATGADLAAIALDPLDERDRVSFDSRRLNWYITCDIVILTIALSTLVLSFYVVRRKWWWLPIWTVWSFAYCIVVFRYSPAYYDADLFHQRLMVEEPERFFRVLSMITAPLSALMVAGGFVAWIVGFFQRELSPVAKLWMRRAAVLSPVVAVIGVLIAQGAWRHSNLETCLDAVASTQGTSHLVELTKDKASKLEKFPDGDLSKCIESGCTELVASIDEIARAVATPLRGAECGTGSTELTVFLPIKDDQWLFAMVGPDRRYADIRNPANTIGFEAVSSILAELPQKNGVRAGFWLLDIFSFHRMPMATVARPLVNNDHRSIGALVAQGPSH